MNKHLHPSVILDKLFCHAHLTMVRESQVTVNVYGPTVAVIFKVWMSQTA